MPRPTQHLTPAARELKSAHQAKRRAVMEVIRLREEIDELAAKCGSKPATKAVAKGLRAIVQRSVERSVL